MYISNYIVNCPRARRACVFETRMHVLSLLKQCSLVYSSFVDLIFFVPPLAFCMCWPFCFGNPYLYSIQRIGLVEFRIFLTSKVNFASIIKRLFYWLLFQLIIDHLAKTYLFETIFSFAIMGDFSSRKEIIMDKYALWARSCSFLPQFNISHILPSPSILLNFQNYSDYYYLYMVFRLFYWS